MRISLPAWLGFWAAAFIIGAIASPARAVIVIADNLLVDLSASHPSAGSASWTNTGSLGGAFSEVSDAQVSLFGNDAPGVWFDGAAGGDAYQGPIAPAGIVSNATRSIEVWAYQLADGQPTGGGDVIEGEETLVGLGRRGGPDGTNLAFNYGSNGTWGAVGHWGPPDMGWNGTPAAGSWHHLTYTYDGSTVRVYADGVLKNSRAVGLNTHSGFPILIGAQNTATGLEAGNRFSGAIGQVRIHDGVLTGAAVANNFNEEAAIYGVTPPPPPPAPVGLVSLYRFDDSAALGADSIRDNDTTPQGDAAFAPGGRYGGAVSLDGAGDMLDRATFPTEVPTGNESYTTAAWIKPDAGGARGIVAWGNYGTGREVNALRLNDTNSLINYWWGADLVADNNDVGSKGINLLDGEWHHVAATFDNLTGERKLFIDGIQVDQDIPGVNNARPLNFAIGRSCTICGGEYYDGMIDDVALFDTSLSPEQIAIVMTGDFRTFGGPAIPEPSTIVLAGMGLALVAAGRMRKGRRGCR